MQNLIHIDDCDDYNKKKSLYIGIKSKWFKCFINSGKNIYNFISSALDILITKYICYLENCNKHKNCPDIFNITLICDCHHYHNYNDNDNNNNAIINHNIDHIVKYNAINHKINHIKKIFNKCHGNIILELINVLKNVDEIWKKDIINVNKKEKKRKIYNHILFGKNIDDPLLVMGTIINNRYLIKNILCEGSSGYLITCLDSYHNINDNINDNVIDNKNKQYVMKISNARYSSGSYINREYDILKYLEKLEYDIGKYDKDIRFPKIIDKFNVPSYIWCTEKNYIAFVMEQYGNDFYNLIMENIKFHKKGLHAKNIQHIAKQLVKTVKVLHDNSIIHKDIKLENLVLQKKNYNYESDPFDIVLIDYGLYINLNIYDNIKNNHYNDNIHNIIDNNNINNVVLGRSYCGTSAYLSPEELCGIEWYKEVDIWTIGIVLFEMYYGDCFLSTDIELNLVILKRIFEEIFPPKMNENIVDIDKYVNKFNENINKIIYDSKGIPYCKNYFDITINNNDLRDLIKKCLEIDKNKRITLESILQHPFITKIY